jgi:hypothetical protein
MDTLPAFTRRPKPDRGPSYQDAVARWLASNAIGWLNHQHKNGLPISQNVDELTAFLDQSARDHFTDVAEDPLHPSGFPKSHRLDLDRIEATNPDRAQWILLHWDPAKIDGRRRGGQHSASTGSKKGPSRRWTPADLMQFWGLPARGRQRAVSEATGMSPAAYYRLSAQMPEFLAMRSQAADERQAQARDFAGLIPVPKNY